MNIQQVAQICHETNRAYCVSIGDASQLSWDDAAEWQRKSAIEGVQFALNNPTAPASAQHDAWLRSKQAEGWLWGNVKDPINKLHPCMVPYNRLPVEQRLKDYLFKAVVAAFSLAETE